MQPQGASRTRKADHHGSGWVGLFLDHPHSLGEGYWQHQRHALRFGTTLILAGLACLIHGLVPALFTRTGSGTVTRLHGEMIATRRLKPTKFNPVASDPSTAAGAVGDAVDAGVAGAAII